MIRLDLAARLRPRIPEIERAIFKRIRNLSEPVGDGDPAYVVGLRSAVAEGVIYGLESIEQGAESSVPIPLGTARQARRAAREGVRLDTVLRRYAAGNKVLEEFLVAEADSIPGEVLCQVLGEQGPHVDRLMELVAAEYRDELEQRMRSPTQMEANRIVRLLESDCMMALPDLDYDFEDWHVGAIVTGTAAALAARSFAENTGYRSLRVARDDETTWVWLGCAQRPVTVDVESIVSGDALPDTFLAIGEPRRGLDGWRQTHHEAGIALQATLCQPRRVTRCRDVILEAAFLRDPRLALSLIGTYLVPLDGSGDSGEVLRRTLSVYFAANQNVTSTAKSIGIDRRTVERHLRKVETILGQSLYTCTAQLQVALRVEELLGSPLATH